MTKALRDIVPLQEISKDTLKSYIKKAGKSVEGITRSSTEQEMSYKRGRNDIPLKSLRRKLKNRHKGISSAVNKLTKESAQLDEISKDTLKSYIKKADEYLIKKENDLINRTGKHVWTPAYRHKKADRPLVRKLRAREIGLDRAEDRLRSKFYGRKKLTKESAQLDEISKKTLANYLKKAAGSLVDIDKKTMYYDQHAKKREAQGRSSWRHFDQLADKSDKKYLKRKKFIDKAADKLANEATQLDEISKIRKQYHKESAQLDEGCQEDNFDRYLASATKVAQEISALLKSYSSHVKSNSTYYPVYTVKEYARNLEDIYDRLTEAVEYAEQDAKNRKQYSDTQTGIKSY